jgi:hypothetical protein
LPETVKQGSVVDVSVKISPKAESIARKEFISVQDSIRANFTERRPAAPILAVKNITQTSCVLEWSELNLGNCIARDLALWKNATRLGSIPRPFDNRMTKLSGLSIDAKYNFYLVLRTSAGELYSNEVEVRTLKLTDLSGLRIALGDVPQSQVSEIEAALVRMGSGQPQEGKLRNGVSVVPSNKYCYSN